MLPYLFMTRKWGHIAHRWERQGVNQVCLLLDNNSAHG